MKCNVSIGFYQYLFIYQALSTLYSTVPSTVNNKVCSFNVFRKASESVMKIVLEKIARGQITQEKQYHTHSHTHKRVGVLFKREKGLY